MYRCKFEGNWLKNIIILIRYLKYCFKKPTRFLKRKKTHKFFIGKEPAVRTCLKKTWSFFFKAG